MRRRSGSISSPAAAAAAAAAAAEAVELNGAERVVSRETVGDGTAGWRGGDRRSVAADRGAAARVRDRTYAPPPGYLLPLRSLESRGYCYCSGLKKVAHTRLPSVASGADPGSWQSACR